MPPFSFSHYWAFASLSAVPGIKSSRWSILRAGVSDLAFIHAQRPHPSWRALWIQQLWAPAIKTACTINIQVDFDKTNRIIKRINDSAYCDRQYDWLFGQVLLKTKIIMPVFQKAGWKLLRNDLLTSRRRRNEADISSKLLSLFDAPDSAKTKKKIEHF